MREVPCFLSCMSSGAAEEEKQHLFRALLGHDKVLNTPDGLFTDLLRPLPLSGALSIVRHEHPPSFVCITPWLKIGEVIT